ncbi:AcrR family transcriptional regulator [Catalinimonas alkaloidigena]|uniref:TetR/AcrR family transcriptional regulator n=1 Tax=Catalinimonas alkaloidigena TaxID=1075417 RepID=UPI0024051985|nr:TetR/AcrR family transcriptional regulator [Catalinimonas alkaloidigena]MDF9797603.1 AcrR family transcriptional regulator [Catalinimonas alkaloidigena]
MESKEQIAQVAEGLFLAYGVRSVTMDDISKKLAISKKTIYQHFRDKDEIVCLVTERVMEREGEQINRIKTEANDVIHELILLSKYIREHGQSVNPSVLFDLQRYHRNAWEIYLRFKENVFLFSLIDTLNRGIEEGFIRSEIDVEVLSLLRLEEMQMAYDADLFPRDKFNFKMVQNQLFDHFVHGILTRKGLDTLYLYQEKKNSNEK